MVLVTGATGSNGTELTKLLASRGVPVRAMVRSRDKARAVASLAGVEAVLGDFDDAASVERALRGVERAFLVTDSSERAEARQRAFVDAARRTGLKRVVKLSQFAADEGSPVRFLRYHAAVERAIVESGIQYTFLRPNLFMQGLLAFRASIAAEGRFFAAAGEARVSVVDVRDIAAAAAAALTGDGHEGRTYDLTGPEALTHAEMAASLSGALGRPVAFVDVPPEAMLKALLGAGLPPWQAEGLVEDYAHYRRGEASAVGPGVRDATGEPPRSFSAFARDYAPAFS
ncbi:MAG: SDR family oxidoreductase [Acetobacteraceae bacterium]|nr:SDR family oxidoreductase [Acetobacteraceae bacterium]